VCVCVFSGRKVEQLGKCVRGFESAIGVDVMVYRSYDRCSWKEAPHITNDVMPNAEIHAR